MPTARVPTDDSRDTVLVATGDTFIGLAIIRSLGRRGVRVMAVSRDSGGIGPYSRYCNRSFNTPEWGENLIGRILEIIRTNGVSHLIATSEELIVLFNQYRDLLQQHVRLLFPPSDAFDLALYKDKTLMLAKEIGVPIPRTEYLNSGRDVAQCSTMRFPVVLKPRHRDIRTGPDRILKFKTDYVSSYEDLVKKIGEFEKQGEYPLVQEYCEGVGVGIKMIVRDGKPIITFQHRRIREYPPAGGGSVFCASTPIDAMLADYSLRLLQAMHWEGVAMVEFRYDTAMRKAALMEVNGRFWGSLPLALHAGADFPYILYKSSVSSSALAYPSSYQIGVRCRTMAGDTKWLLAQVMESPKMAFKYVAEYLRAFSPGTKYYGWALDDPVPPLMNFLLRLKNMGLSLVKNFARMLRTSSGAHV